MSLLRLQPFDTSTPNGRSNERYRRIVLTAAAAFVARGAGILVSLVTVPLAVGYLGTERYGMWMTAGSIVAMLGFADLGIGNGLLNAVAEAHGKNDREAASRYVSSAFVVLSGIALLIISILFVAFPFVSWARLYNVATDLAARESGPATAVVVVIFAANMPIALVQNVQMGYQEGYKTHLWGIAGVVLAFCGLLIAIHLQAGLFWLVLAMAGCPVLARFANSGVEFGIRRPWLLPRPRTVEWSAAKRIATTGGLFLILQLLTIVGASSDNFVIAQMIGPSAVAGYAVTQRLFSLTQVAQFFITPLWPAFGEAMARSDHAWARMTLTRALVLSLILAAAISLPLVLLGKWLVMLWVGKHLVPSTSLLVGFASWTLLVSYGGVMSTFLNSGPLLGRQVVFYAAASITSLVLKVVLAGPWGGVGVVWASVFGFGVFYVFPSARLAYGSFRTGDGTA